ncbi:MAG: J domain-containing protein [Treponema sp.]|jgi:DnaJ-domain-containing protein 1|nr:J domain-containing protein [Treponema sp.]
MGILDRLEDVLKSYINDGRPSGGRPFGRSRSGGSGDPDLDDAFAELDDFLGDAARPGASAHTGGGKEAAWDEKLGDAASGGAGPPPEGLRRDFAEMGLPFGASAGDCKAAYKRLLKLHHPDRHAGHPEDVKKATEKSSRVNAAFDRINQWRETGRTG